MKKSLQLNSGEHIFSPLVKNLAEVQPKMAIETHPLPLSTVAASYLQRRLFRKGHRVPFQEGAQGVHRKLAAL